MKTKQERRAVFDKALNEAIETGRPDPKPERYDGDPEWQVGRLFDEEGPAQWEQNTKAGDKVEAALRLIESRAWATLDRRVQQKAMSVMQDFLADDEVKT